MIAPSLGHKKKKLMQFLVRLLAPICEIQYDNNYPSARPARGRAARCVLSRARRVASDATRAVTTDSSKLARSDVKLLVIVLTKDLLKLKLVKRKMIFFVAIM